MNLQKPLTRFLIWRIKHIRTKNFVLILSGIIGAIAGVASVILKESVHSINHLLTHNFNFEFANYLYVGYPLIGILFTVIIAKYVLKEQLGHGITDILYAISKKSGKMKPSRMYSRMVTSAITVGFGGSVGLEAPVVLTGSAIGSNIGQLVHLNYRNRTLLIGCGSAGAISAIFNSPIAGVIFSIEVIMAGVTINSFIPLLIASVCGSLVSLMLLGDDVLFSFKLTDHFEASDVPYYIILGFVCGLVSVYFTRLTYLVEGFIERVKKRVPRAIFGGFFLGVIIFVFPPIYGEGYAAIKALLNGMEGDVLNNSMFFRHFDNKAFIIIFLFGVLLIKPVASALTIGSGGSGGIFAPSLFLGGITGFVFASSINLFGSTEIINTSHFTLVGMCGIMSGVLHAPLTGIFLIAEITSGYTLFVPLMLVSAISYSTTSYFEKYSIYTKHLIERGDLIPHDKDRQVLSLIDLNKLVEKDLLVIRPDATLFELVNLVRISKRNIFPVVTPDQKLEGIVTLDDIREIMFNKDSQNNVIISSILHKPPAEVSNTDNMETVMTKFETTGAWNLPVIDNGKYVGFLSKSRIFNAYRKKLVKQNVE